MTGTGRLVLVFDDGYATDSEVVRPVLESYGVPAVFAIVPTWLDEPGHLTRSALDDLVDAGCEVAAHGHRHRYLQSHGLSRDAAAGEERVVLDSSHVFPEDEAGVVVGDRYEVADGTGSETVRIQGAEATDDGVVVHLAASLEREFVAEESVVRPAMAVVREEIVGGGAALRDVGVDPRTFVFPYDAADVRAWSLAGEQYDVVANAAVRSLPNPRGTAPTNLRRWYVETDHLTDVGLDGYLDVVAEQGGVGVLAGHSARDTLPPERVERVLEGALERGIEVATFRNL